MTELWRERFHAMTAQLGKGGKTPPAPVIVVTKTDAGDVVLTWNAVKK